MSSQAKGLFITFEGSEGTGKTTQIQKLAGRLRSLGKNVVLSREPGGTPLGEEIRHLLQHAESGRGMGKRTELLLFAASRAQHVDALIKPGIEKGGIVISDRFLDSTTVYQGVARAIDAAAVDFINQFAIDAVWPDITVVIDLNPEEGFSRIKDRSPGLPDRMEQEHINFYKAVRQGYLDLAEKEPQRFLVVDGALKAENVAEDIWNGIKDRII